MYQAISSKLTHNIFAMAVAQLPPPITANFGDLFMKKNININQKYSF
jgi:hypothetical protein